MLATHRLGEQTMPDDLPKLEYDSNDDVDEPMKIPSQEVPFQLEST